MRGEVQKSRHGTGMCKQNAICSQAMPPPRYLPLRAAQLPCTHLHGVVPAHAGAQVVVAAPAVDVGVAGGAAVVLARHHVAHVVVH